MYSHGQIPYGVEGDSGTRVVLLFDVWRSELSDEEQRLVAGLFEAIDDYNGTKPHWEI